MHIAYDAEVLLKDHCCTISIYMPIHNRHCSLTRITCACVQLVGRYKNSTSSNETIAEGNYPLLALSWIINPMLQYAMLLASLFIISTSELPVKIFTDSGKFTNVHAKNIHWCMQGPYIGLYRPITVKTSVSSQS